MSTVMTKTDRYILTITDFCPSEGVNEVTVTELAGCRDFASADALAKEQFDTDVELEKQEGAGVDWNATGWDSGSGTGTIQWLDDMTAAYEVKNIYVTKKQD